MLLFRGDRNGDAKVYRTDGLITRLMKGGRPDVVEIAGQWEVSRAHVMPRTPGEERFLSQTPFLSFTEDRAKAERYALGRQSNMRLEPSHKMAPEDTLLFTLRVDGMRSDGHDGVFVLDYNCDYSQIWAYPAADDYINQAGNSSCEFCAPSNVVVAGEERIDGKGRRLHRIRLVRVAQFLRSGGLRSRYAGAIRQAERDREWLIYPMDYIQRLKGYSARVPPSRIWSVEWFKVVA
jgi:hypothetical protein